MAAVGLGAATVNVLANTAGFERSMKKAMKRVAAGLAVYGAGRGIAELFTTAISDSIELERSLARIHTIVDNTADLQLFEPADIRQFSNALGIATQEIADAQYLALSSGVAAKDVADVTNQAAKLAKATGADLPIVIDAITSSLNAFKDTGMTATKTTDILFKALQYGKGSMRDFARYISNAIPMADSLGVSLEELAALGAASTLTGKTARVSFTGIKVAMQELSDATKGGGLAFKELFGETFQAYIKRTGDLTGAFGKLSKEIGSKNLTNVFGAKEGAAAIQNLAALQDQVNYIVPAVKEAEGAAAEAFEKIERTVGFQLDRVKQSLRNYVGSLGDSLGPATRNSVDAAAVAFEWFRGAVSDSVDWIKLRWQEAQVAWGDFTTALNNIGALSILQGLLADLGQNFLNLGQMVQDAFTIAKAALDPFLVPLGALAVAFTAIFGTALLASINLVMDAVQGLFGFLADNETLVGAIAIAIGVITTALMAQSFWLWATTTAALAYGAAVALASGAVALLTGAIGLLTAAFMANPIGFIVTVLAALAAAFVYAWQHSETFRNVVKRAINAVSQFVVGGIKRVADIVMGFFETIINGAAKAFGWVPGIGGKLKAAAENFAAFRQTVNEQLAAIQKNVYINVHVNKDPVEEMASDEGNRGRAQDYVNTGRSATDVRNYTPAAPAIPAFNAGIDFGGGGGTGNYNPDDKAGKEAASKLKDALARVLADLKRIAKDTSKQSADTIANNFKQLYDDLTEAGQKKLIPGIRKIEKKLIGYAKKLDTSISGSVGARLDLAKDKLKDLTKESEQFTDAIKKQVMELGNVADESRGLGTTYTGMRNQLRAAVLTTRQFTGYIDKLRKMKLNETSLRQIIEAGPADGMQAAKALVQAGQKGVDDVDKLQKDLDKAAGKLATSAYDQFYKHGINIAKGLVLGLEKEKSAIVKAMDKIADSLVVSIKKKLAIKSPSGVMEELFGQIPAGAAKGIERKGHLVGRAMQNITHNTIDVAVHGVQDPNAARRAGILSGEGIQNVLTRTRADAFKPVV